MADGAQMTAQLAEQFFSEEEIAAARGRRDRLLGTLKGKNVYLADDMNLGVQKRPGDLDLVITTKSVRLPGQFGDRE